MSDQYTILTEYIKDISSETPSIDTYLYVKDIITKYNLNILINSTAIKNNLIEVCTKLTYLLGRLDFLFDPLFSILFDSIYYLINFFNRRFINICLIFKFINNFF